MGLILQPTGSSPERLFGYGAQGAGKTFAYFCAANKTDGHFYVLDTDMTVLDFLDGERFAHLADRFTYHVPMDFGDAIETVEKWAMEAKPNDWLVADRIDWAWDASQSEFSEKVFGGSIDEHFLAYRQAIEQDKDKGKKAGNPFEGFTDWPTIKKRHARLVRAFLVATSRGVHWYWAAGEKKVDEKLDDSDTVRNYGRIGARPAGEKTNGHVPRTVLRFQGNNPATWRVSTVKDREREQLDGATISDFATDYLMKVAGWRPTAGGK